MSRMMAAVTGLPVNHDSSDHIIHWLIDGPSPALETARVSGH
jgi:hypothetical protein